MDDDTIEVPENDPLQAAIEIRKQIYDLKRGYRRNLWRCVAEAYAVAFAMASNRKAWKELLAEDFWRHYRKKRPSVKSTEKALLHVMVFVFDATSKNRYDRAWKYAKALEKPFTDKVPPECIEEVIEESGGLEKMMRAAVGKRKDAAKRAPLSSEDSYADVNDADQAEESDNAENQQDGKHNGRKGGEKDEYEKYRRNKNIDILRKGHKNKPLNSPGREFRFSATKKLGATLRRMAENEKARLMIKIIERDGCILARITGVRLLSG
jgi:hypothetical protein